MISESAGALELKVMVVKMQGCHIAILASKSLFLWCTVHMCLDITYSMVYTQYPLLDRSIYLRILAVSNVKSDIVTVMK